MCSILTKTLGSFDFTSSRLFAFSHWLDDIALFSYRQCNRQTPEEDFCGSYKAAQHLQAPQTKEGNAEAQMF